jgi:hypothetical protein
LYSDTRQAPFLLPDDEGYMNTYEMRNSESGRLFTELQKYVIVVLPKLPEEDDGQAIWTQLQFPKISRASHASHGALPDARPRTASL